MDSAAEVTGEPSSADGQADPRNRRVAHRPVAARAAALAADVVPCAPGACITNGTILLAVGPEGQLSVEDGTGSLAGPGEIGLRFLPTGGEATSHGCFCEGWGVADTATGVTGHAKNSIDTGSVNLQPAEFASTASTARSVVEVRDTFRVTHDFHPSPATPNLYEVAVTITNISAGPLTDVVYRRVTDWDADPTPFQEFVTVNAGTGTHIRFASDDGFASGDPLSGPSDLGHTGSFTDAGPEDLGALFDLGLGALPAGGKVSFRVFYGAAPSEADAIKALAAVKAEAFSFGQPNVEGGPTLGTPNTFILAFAGIGGAPLYTPVALPDSLSSRPGVPATIDVRANDTDPNNEPLTVTSSTDGQHGTVTCLPAGPCTYTSAPDYSGPDQFTYTITNTSGESATGTVTVTVTANQPPTTSAGPDVTTKVGIPVELRGDATDPDSNPVNLRWTIASVAHPGAENGCRFTNPAAAITSVTCDQPGTYTATLATSDGNNPTVTDQTTITVQPAPTGCADGPIQTELPLYGGYLSVADFHLYSNAVDVNVPCGRYNISLISGDSSHTPGYQPNQTGEQWVLEGLDANGKVIYASAVTPDLGEDRKQATFDIGTADLTGVVKIRGHHAGTSGTINSLHYLAVNLTPADPSNTTCADPATTTDFPLDSHLGPGTHQYSPTVPVNLGCHRYAVTLTSGDNGHAPGYQPEQANEQWVLEGLDANGKVRYTSAPTPDLPEDQKTASFDMGEADLTGVTQLRARHAQLSTGENSIHHASVTLRPMG